MSADSPEARIRWKAQLVAFLIPHLHGDEAERDSALNAVMTAIDTAHSEGLRHAARVCREVAERAGPYGDAAVALAETIEQMAAHEDERSAEAARQWQDGQ
ncbi:hypothetical protein MKK88_02420 [Methylobacterium sp. E-005]|uniref:hypothetical protein n=1 Tax=Methylobacterium sp. E-005 TaxID=2836549 RepID=UPI001FBA9AFD|nr:hypothetical protein [Methylobacterium sp. E-005]MCJ2084848.1 hypothetical protein [Methylobacterium sp. E-005]